MSNFCVNDIKVYNNDLTTELINHLTRSVVTASISRNYESLYGFVLHSCTDDSNNAVCQNMGCELMDKLNGKRERKFFRLVNRQTARIRGL